MTPDIIKVAALCIRNNKLLLVRSHNYEMFFTLGGKLEKNETDSECLKREVKEEAGCEVKSINFFDTFNCLNHDKTKTLRIICYFVDLAGDPLPCSEIAEIHWWDANSSIKLSDTLKDEIIPKLVFDGWLEQ